MLCYDEGEMKKLLILLFLLCIIFLAVTPALARITVNEVAKELIAPCCYTQTVADHPSEIAEQIKCQIKMMIDRGISKQQIINFYVKQYGEKILASPPKSGFGLTAYLIPLAFLLLATSLIVSVTRRWAREGKSSYQPLPLKQADKEIEKRLEEELRKFNKY